MSNTMKEYIIKLTGNKDRLEKLLEHIEFGNTTPFREEVEQFKSQLTSYASLQTKGEEKKEEVPDGMFYGTEELYYGDCTVKGRISGASKLNDMLAFIRIHGYKG